ncbi:hypothetical protein CEXT_27031, partial [Caerostris extrusa]
MDDSRGSVPTFPAGDLRSYCTNMVQLFDSPKHVGPFEDASLLSLL